jgi:hypothetical protein
VHVLGRGQPGANVDELPDAFLPDQVADHPAEHLPLRPDANLNGRHRRDDPVAERPVGGVIVFPAQQVVVDADWVSDSAQAIVTAANRAVLSSS